MDPVCLMRWRSDMALSLPSEEAGAQPAFSSPITATDRAVMMNSGSDREAALYHLIPNRKVTLFRKCDVELMREPIRSSQLGTLPEIAVFSRRAVVLPRRGNWKWLVRGRCLTRISGVTNQDCCPVAYETSEGLSQSVLLRLRRPLARQMRR
jgi:hypothetical protein